MIRIGIIEDDPQYVEQFTGYIKKYAEESGEKFDIKIFSDGIDLVSDYNASYDILFMDIQMKLLDGMSTAKSIRKMDKDVIIIFVTNLPQFAIQGYEVEAMNYVLKPVNFFAFSQELLHAIKKLKSKTTFYLNIMQESKMIRLDVSRIFYIESQGHTILYHTEDGTFSNRDTLKNQEQKLTGKYFSRCNNCYLVNLRHVEKVDRNTVTVAGVMLQTSRPKRKNFINELAIYVGGEKG